MTVPDELIPQYDLDYGKGRSNRYAGKIDKSQDVMVLDGEAGLDAGPTATLDDRDEYPEVTQADLDRATFRIGLKIPVPNAADDGRSHDGDPDATRDCEHDDAITSTPEWLKVAESAFQFWDNPIDAAYDDL